MPICDRARSTLLTARKIPLGELVGGSSIEDHDVCRLAAREPGGNRLRRVAQRGTTCRDQAVAGRALEPRPQLRIDAVETGRDHHVHVGSQHRGLGQQGNHKARLANDRASDLGFMDDSSTASRSIKRARAGLTRSVAQARAVACASARLRLGLRRFSSLRSVSGSPSDLVAGWLPDPGRLHYTNASSAFAGFQTPKATVRAISGSKCQPVPMGEQPER